VGIVVVRDGDGVLDCELIGAAADVGKNIIALTRGFVADRYNDPIDVRAPIVFLRDDCDGSTPTLIVN
jgi:hypothetical protein